MTARRYGGPAVLALLAIISAACTEPGVRPTNTVQAADSADQILFKIQHYVTQDGVKRSLVEADTAYMYEPSQTAELRGVRVTFYNNIGAESSELTAREGTYLWQTGEMVARRDVVGTTPDARRLRTSVLRYEPHSQKISSDQFFTFDRGSDHLEGEGFTSDTDFRNVIVQRPRGAEGGGRLLPGQ